MTPFQNSDSFDKNKKTTIDIQQWEKFNKTLTASHRILYKAKTVFPFDFFPDWVIIDENKVDIITGLFFFSREVFSIPIKNIINARSSNNIFFGSLDIEVDGYNKNPAPITHLWNKDANRIRRIINGLAMATKSGVDISSLPLDKAIDQVEQIGRAKDR